MPGFPDPQPRGIPEGVFEPVVDGSQRADPRRRRRHHQPVGARARRLDPHHGRRAGPVVPGARGAGARPRGTQRRGQVDLPARAGRAVGTAGRRGAAAIPTSRSRGSETHASSGPSTWPDGWPGCRSGPARRSSASTVLDEVMTTSRAVGLVESEALARARALLAHLGLAHLEQADPRHLSGGEQRRLAMASAVVHQPALVCADEATVGQDRLTWAAVMGIVEGLRDAGSAIVLTTHDDAVIDAGGRRDDDRAPRPAAARTHSSSAPRARAGPLSLLAAREPRDPRGGRLAAVVHQPRRAGVQAALAVTGPVGPRRRGPRPARRLRGVLLRTVPGGPRRALGGVVDLAAGRPRPGHRLHRRVCGC